MSNKTISNEMLLTLIVFFILLLLLSVWALFMIKIELPESKIYTEHLYKLIEFIIPYIRELRLGYLFFTLFAVLILRPKGFTQSTSPFLVSTVVSFTPFIITCCAFIEINNAWFIEFAYPLSLLLSPLCIWLSFSLLYNPKKSQSEKLFGLSNKKTDESDISFKYSTTKGSLTVHSAVQHIMVIGGTGSGKSESILKPSIYQHIQKDLPALIYDFKGNPMTLGKTAYSAYKTIQNPNSKFQIFNLNDTKRSLRVNPFHYKYLQNSQDRDEIVSTLLKNLSPNFKVKQDIWYEGAKAIWLGLIVRFIMDEDLKEKLSLPLLIELISTNEISVLLEFINQNHLSSQYISSILATINTDNQFAGYISTLKSSISSIVGDKNLYYMLSKNQINLNINSPESPTILCVASNGITRGGYSSIIATIISVVMKCFNRQNQLPTLFQLDELYTIFLEDLPSQANTIRSNKVCMQIGLQTTSQLRDIYGREKANSIIGACGNQFYGMSNEPESANQLIKLLSDIEQETESITRDRGDNKSINISKRKSKVKEIRDITQQPPGHFTGKISGGNPTFFHCQFKPFYKQVKEIDIPECIYRLNTTDKELEKEIYDNYNMIKQTALDILSKEFLPNKYSLELNEEYKTTLAESESSSINGKTQTENKLEDSENNEITLDDICLTKNEINNGNIPLRAYHFKILDFLKNQPKSKKDIFKFLEIKESGKQRKRYLYPLTSQEYIVKSKKGRENIYSITEKGREIFSSKDTIS